MRIPSPLSRFALGALFALIVAACGPVEQHGAPRAVVGGPATTLAVAATSTQAPTTTATVPPVIERGVVTIPRGGAPVFDARGGERQFMIHEGIVMGFERREGRWIEVVATCNEPLWLRADDVEITAAGEGAGAPGRADMAEATVVIDPGHGDRDWGGVGPTGLSEKGVNLDISVRLRELLLSAHDVDWDSGDIAPGTAVPAADRVWLTRDPSGANEGDYELGLAFRSHLANAAGADVFVSIHNNTVPTSDPEGPGSEVFYAVSVDGSDRLASLIHQELLRSFSQYAVDWKGGLITGARSRIDPETDTDYYGVLRRAAMPAVIVEGVYISEPEEEALLKTPEFRQSYAEAVYRGIVRFLTTNATGETINPPEIFTSDAGTVNTSSCVVPQQR